MKSRILTWFTATILLSVTAIPVQLAAQDKGNQDQPDMHPHYQLIDLGTLGGSYSNALAINDRERSLAGDICGAARPAKSRSGTMRGSSFGAPTHYTRRPC
jgi:hypothetical protein